MPRTIPGKEIAHANKGLARLIAPGDHGRITWDVTLQVHQTFDDLLSPGFWDHKSSELKAGQRVFAATVDHRFYVEGYITAVKPEVIVQWEDPVTLSVVELLAGYSFGYDQRRATFTVVRSIDGFVMGSGFSSREIAAEWLEKQIMPAPSKGEAGKKAA